MFLREGAITEVIPQVEDEMTPRDSGNGTGRGLWAPKWKRKPDV